MPALADRSVHPTADRRPTRSRSADQSGRPARLAAPTPPRVRAAWRPRPPRRRRRHRALRVRPGARCACQDATRIGQCRVRAESAGRRKMAQQTTGRSTMNAIAHALAAVIAVEAGDTAAAHAHISTRAAPITSDCPAPAPGRGDRDSGRRRRSKPRRRPGFGSHRRVRRRSRPAGPRHGYLGPARDLRSPRRRQPVRRVGGCRVDKTMHRATRGGPRRDGYGLLIVRGSATLLA